MASDLSTLLPGIVLDGDAEPPSKRQRIDVVPFIKGRHREVGLMRRGGKRDASSFVGSSSGIYFIRSVYNALENKPNGSGRHAVPGEDDQLSTRNDQLCNSEELWCSAERSIITTSITFDQLKDLSEEYFEIWHVTLPFIFAPSILDAFDRISTASLLHVESVTDRYDLVMIRAIMSISAADRRQCGKVRQHKSVPQALLFNSYTDAVESVQAFLSAPATLKSLQAVLAVQLFLISMLRHNAATRIGGLAVRLAFQLGLHRCPARYAFPLEEAQMRKRVFWTTYCLDRLLCHSLGLPLSIRDDDIDVCCFDREKHQDPSLPQSPLDPRLASLHFLVKHAGVKGLIVEQCNKNLVYRSLDKDSSHTVDVALSRWANEMDAFMDINPNDPVFHKGRMSALQSLQFECIMAFNRPLLALSKDSSDHTIALQTCINAARSIIAVLHAKLIAHLGKVASRDDKRVLTPLFWPSFTWMVWMSAFVVLYAALEDELPKEAAKRLVQKSVEVLDHLSSRGTEWPSACAAAIRGLSAKLDAPPSDRKTPCSETDDILLRPVRTEPDVALSQSDTDKHNGASTFVAAQPGETNVMPSENATSDDTSYQQLAWSHEAFALSDDIPLFDGFDIPFSLGDDFCSSVFSDWHDS